MPGLRFSQINPNPDYHCHYFVIPIITIINILYTAIFAAFLIHLYKIKVENMITGAATANSEKKCIAIFASGAGSNAKKIIDHFNLQNAAAKVVLIVSNNPHAGVLKIAEKENIPFLLIERKKFYEDGYLDELKKYQPDLMVLAGFMWKVPPVLTRSYQNKIINIHPALLPKFGGKGMYGNFVHQAVVNAGENESGITIHYADDIYDNGKIIFQAKCTVDRNDTPENLAAKIHTLEHAHYPLIIESLLR